jgi:hypothetical protein
MKEHLDPRILEPSRKTILGEKGDVLEKVQKKVIDDKGYSGC